MNKTFYVLLCLISYHAFAGDFGNDEECGAEVEEEELGEANAVNPVLEPQLEGGVEGENFDEASLLAQPRYSLQQPANIRPGSACDLSHELAELCYGKVCKSNKFCLKPFKKHFKNLNQTDHQQYLRVVELIQTKKTKSQHRGIGNLMLTNDIPIELMQFTLKALKKEDKLKTGAILKHERTSKDKDYTIKDLKTWGSRKNWGLVGTIGSCVILILGYLGYTVSPC